MAFNPDDPLLKEIRDGYDYQVRSWQDIRDEGKKDMKFVLGDPWDPKERRERVGAGRPVLSVDELNQYCNQIINDVRQNKRAVKVVPKGAGATDQTAEARGAMIRQIEYKSRAQSAYITAFENMIQRSYGAWKYKTQYISDSAFEQELVICRVPNPDVIYFDWDAKEIDCSDANCAYEIETMRKSRFTERWKDAEITDFSEDMQQLAPAWLKGDMVQVASYWKLKRDRRTLLALQDGRTAYLEDIKKEKPGAKFQKAATGRRSERLAGVLIVDGGEVPIVRKRETEDRAVCQYITNGIELLETKEWVGKYIPLVPLFGKELWVDEGGGAKRHLISLVRLARDSQMLYAYARTCQAELAGMAPKTVLLGYEGQFDTNTDWKNLHKIPTMYAEVKGKTDESADAGTPFLPLPTFIPFNPPIDRLEILAEAARRAIQSAMGITGLLNGTATGANPESGEAFKRLGEQEAGANFHFKDNYLASLEYGGRIMDDALAAVYDTDREVGFRKLTEEHYTARINRLDPNGEKLRIDEKGQPIFHTDEGDHDLTISTGPSSQSQREEAQNFTDQLINVPNVAPLILDLVVKLRDLGPIGDEVSKRLYDHFVAPQGQQIPPAVQQKLQQMSAVIQKLMQERQAKVIEQQGKAFIANAQQQVDLQKKRMDLEATLLQSLIKSGQETNAQGIEQQLEQWITVWEQMHEFQSQQSAQQHERDLAAQEHQQQLQQAEHAAAIAPPPAAAPPAQPQV